MTNEEAIENNKNLRMYMKLSDKNQPCKFLEENYIALDMAIEALSAEPCKDCISREAVLELAKNECETAVIPYKRFVKLLNALSSVQPKTDVLDKIRTEIEQRPYGIANDSVIQGIKYERMVVLEIIDKYKAESKE